MMRRGRDGISTPHLSARFSVNGLAHNRFGFIISNKVEKKSSLRHYWKRRLSDSVGLWPSFGLDVLLTLRSGLSKREKNILEKETKQVLVKIKQK